jgi:5-methyltetrahydropteroyltriglutamate--homocysteine methyltransferase
MKRSEHRILTTHVGALPAPEDIWGNKNVPEQRLVEAVTEVVNQQRNAGVDIVNEGELTKGGNWVAFINSRLSGFTPVDNGELVKLLLSSPDWVEFSDYYEDAMANGTLFEGTAKAPEQTGGNGEVRDFICDSPIEYIGLSELEMELKVARAALGESDPGDMFITSTAPASLEPGRVNQHYKDDEEYLFALADAMRVEYEAIANAGFIVQVDDAWLAALWDRIGIPMGLDAYRKYAQLRMEALNHGLRNIPEEQVRYHLCWGSWHGPHSYDLPLADIVDILLTVNAQTYLIEGANARHEHEYSVWDDVKLPEGKILAPGVVSHATALIEHPQLVCERICRYADRLGKENVVASTDCGLGLRCHPQIAWAKLRALSEGAMLASEKLW